MRNKNIHFVKMKKVETRIPAMPNLLKVPPIANKTFFKESMLSFGTTMANEVIHVEDYDASVDERFLKEHFEPYLKTLFTDLLHRFAHEEDDNVHLAKVTFVEYTQLPGIINSRLFYMFQRTKYLYPLSLEVRDYITEQQFVENFKTIFMGDLDQKMKFTFDMYDFDNDGFITPEDVRIMMSYMPFNRDICSSIQIQNVQNTINLLAEKPEREGRFFG